MSKGEVIVFATKIHEGYAAAMGPMAKPFEVRMPKATSRNERFDISVEFLKTVLNKCSTLSPSDKTSIEEALK